MDLFANWDKSNNSWFDWISANSWLPHLENTLQQARKTSEFVYPETKQILRAWQLTPLEKVKVIIIGQDPYHGYQQANGLAFSVNKGQVIPPSLRNIFRELQSNYTEVALQHGDLSDWAKQGVFLLNTILTVADSKPLAHQFLGWEAFTLATIKKLNTIEKPLVFMLWGKQARAFETLLNNPSHLVLTSAHPSPLSAHRGFFGNQHFFKANDFLSYSGQKPIDWNLRDSK